MITYDMETIGYINLFERLTGARAKDCFAEEEKLVFVVNEGEAGKAIGKNGEKARELSAKLKKQIKIIEFKQDPVEFLKTLLYPVKAKEVTAVDDKIIIKTHNIKEKGQIYGREKTNLKRVQDLFSKYFPHRIELE